MDDKYQLPRVDFRSELVETLFEIERLRSAVGMRSTPPGIYQELHLLFDTVMSVVSARIEGNHTTIYEALDRIASPPPQPDERLQEITNILAAVRFIDTLDRAAPIDHALVRELHHRVVTGLEHEGDHTPGAYRRHDVRIAASSHVPPSWVTVHAEMTSLLDFANAELPAHQQMIQIALAHHMFVWIHPFGNGNGRVSRLVTYAMLRRTVFATRGYSALNPAAVFGNDREAYIHALEAADTLTDPGRIDWITFFVRGLRDDLHRLVQLQDHEFVSDRLITPAIDSLARDGLATRAEVEALRIVLRQGTVKAGELASALPGSSPQRSRAIGALLDRRLLRRAPDGPRFYQLDLASGPLAGRLVRQLDVLGYLPKMLSDD